MSNKKIGIEKLSVYPGKLYLNLEELAKYRGYNINYLQKDLMVSERSVNPLWEDSVTMAVNAAKLLLNEQDKNDIGLLLVGTETSVDNEKSISSWVHRFLNLPSCCRHFEIKSACYSGTACLQVGLSWLLSQKNNNKKVLLITTDQSLIALRKPYEYVTGAGAVAVLLSNNPLLLSIEMEKMEFILMK